MTTLARLTIVTAAFLAFPAAVVLAGPRFGYTTTETVLYALLTLPAAAVIAICVASSFHKADQTIAAAARFQAAHGHQPTDTTGETR